MTEGLALPLSAEKNLILGIHNKEPIKRRGRLNWIYTGNAYNFSLVQTEGNIFNGNMTVICGL